MRIVLRMRAAAPAEQHGGMVGRVLIALVVMVAAGPLAAPAGATLPGRNGVIAVVRGDPAHRDQQLVLLRQDGTVAVRVVGWPTAGIGVLWPAWSPDGRRLAYSVGVGAAEVRLGVVRADGSHTRTLPRPAPFVDAVAPAWRPDGRRIAFGAVGFDVGGIWTVDTAGQHARRVSPRGQLPSWSADGRLAVGDGGVGVWTMNADGSRLRKVAGRGADDPDWSPSGTRIAYTQVRHGREEVWTMRGSGAGKRRVAVGAQPSWSPDGRRIAFVRSGRLFTVSAAGRDERKVPYTPRAGSRTIPLTMPAWQPLR